MDNDNYRRRIKKKGPQRVRKSEYDKRRTHQEVQQIKNDLINFAKTSWGKQWISSILMFGRPFRMQRGIEYAKDDKRIENLRINKGQIFSTVQGTAPTPYRVKINFEIISEDKWKIIIDELANKSSNLISLLEGKLPEDIINIFKKNEYSLFPDVSRGLDAECSCPDKEIPCKHIASVILYISKVLDYDPFILLKLKGKSKNEILKELSLSQHLVNDSISELLSSPIKKNERVGFSFNIPKIEVQEISSSNLTLGSSFNFNDLGFKFRKPGKLIETLENLGIPPNIRNPQSFKIVLSSIYQTIISEFYKKSLKL
ncbi:MAG: SWIM zinc finger family protein [Promethearchaeota archaeon]